MRFYISENWYCSYRCYGGNEGYINLSPVFRKSWITDTWYYFTFMTQEFSGMRIIHQLEEKSKQVNFPQVPERLFYLRIVLYMPSCLLKPVQCHVSLTYFCLTPSIFLCPIKNKWVLFKSYTYLENKQTNKHFFNQDKMQKALVLSSGICSYFLSKKYESDSHLPFQ